MITTLLGWHCSRCGICGSFSGEERPKVEFCIFGILPHTGPGELRNWRGRFRDCRGVIALSHCSYWLVIVGWKVVSEWTQNPKNQYVPFTSVSLNGVEEAFRGYREPAALLSCLMVCYKTREFLTIGWGLCCFSVLIRGIVIPLTAGTEAKRSLLTSKLRELQRFLSVWRKSEICYTV
jgi:hypothetical protein